MPVYRIHSRASPERQAETTRAERRARCLAIALSAVCLAYTIYCLIAAVPRPVKPAMLAHGNAALPAVISTAGK